MEQASKFIIREFRPQDLDAVVRINRLVLPENYPVFFFKIHHENFPKAFLVAEIEGRVVGYVMCRVETGHLFTRNAAGRQGHVISLAVLPEARRMGIGTSLMREALKNLHEVYGVDEYYLEVRVSNTPAINLYNKLGFKPHKVIKGYYRDGEDAYLMVREAGPA